MALPAQFRSNVVILLIGGNPLPVYVSACLLAGEGVESIYLVHSEKNANYQSTEPFAKFIKRVLLKNYAHLRDDQIILNGIHANDGSTINTQIKKLLDRIPENSRIGFNYTGGTKPMAIHAYQTVKSKFEHAIFSYLDADSLSMWIDGVKNGGIPCKTAVNVNLLDIANLHGYQFDSIRYEPRRIDLSRAIMEAHFTEKGMKDWRDWLNAVGNTPDDQTPPLPPASYSLFDKINLEFNRLCNGKATSQDVAKQFGFKSLKSCTIWLLGGWLEELTLDSAFNLKELGYFHDYGGNFKTIPGDWTKTSSFGPRNDAKNFELDVAAMRGYQLFGFSCIASRKPGGETKKHMLEAYVRAKQLGGDEARVALVCLTETPEQVLNEIEREWLTTKGHVKVFGIHQLEKLTENIKNWLEKC
jgi:hypothetical protein